MTESNRRKKKYLLSYWAARNLIRNYDYQLAELRAEYASAKSQNLDGMPHAHNVEHDLSDYAARIDKLLTTIARAKARCVALRDEVTQRIESMDNDTEKDILYNRYINGYRFADIADMLNYTERHTLRLHGDALTHFKY